MNDDLLAFRGVIGIGMSSQQLQLEIIDDVHHGFLPALTSGHQHSLSGSSILGNMKLWIHDSH